MRANQPEVIYGAVCLLIASALLPGHRQLRPPGASTPLLAERVDAIVQAEILAKGVPSVTALPERSK